MDESVVMSEASWNESMSEDGGEQFSCDEVELEKWELLVDLETNTTDTLKLKPVSDPDYNQQLVHELYGNTSIEKIMFLQPEEKDEEPMTAPEWMQLMAVFRGLGKRIKMLQVQGAMELPFFVVTTAVWHFRNLEELVLDDLSPEAKKSLAKALWQHPTLRIFRLGSGDYHRQIDSCRYNDTLVKTLANTVPTLEVYESCHHRMSMDALVELIRSASSLKKLLYHHSGFLSMNSLDSLMEAIKKSALTELCLAGNEIDDETACLIAHGVKATPSIQNLDLHSNHFGSDTETVETFASLLHSNKTLVHIDLTQCQFTPENFQPIMIAMESTWCLLAV